MFFVGAFSNIIPFIIVGLFSMGAFFISIQDNFSENFCELKSFHALDKRIEVSETNTLILQQDISQHSAKAYFVERILPTIPKLPSLFVNYRALNNKLYHQTYFQKIPTRGSPILLS